MLSSRVLSDLTQPEYLDYMYMHINYPCKITQ